MATYQPPTEILPKFNEFVFTQANEPEYLDLLVVHKAGTETITGNKTFTGAVNINGPFNITTDIVADKPSFDITNTGGDMVLNPSGDLQLQKAGVPKFTATINETYIQTTLVGSIYAEVAGINKIAINDTTTTIANGSLLITAPTNVLITAATNFEVNSGIGQLQFSPPQINTTFATINSFFTNAFTVGLLGGGFNNLTVSPSIITLRNATLTNVATTAFKVQNALGTDRLIISPTSYSFNSDATCAIFMNAGTFYQLITGTSCSITSGDSMSIVAGTTLVITSITSSEFRVNTVQKLLMTTALTTLTNTAITFTGGGGLIKLDATGAGGSCNINVNGGNKQAINTVSSNYINTNVSVTGTSQLYLGAGTTPTIGGTPIRIGIEGGTNANLITTRIMATPTATTETLLPAVATNMCFGFPFCVIGALGETTTSNTMIRHRFGVSALSIGSISLDLSQVPGGATTITLIISRYTANGVTLVVGSAVTFTFVTASTDRTLFQDITDYRFESTESIGMTISSTAFGGLSHQCVVYLNCSQVI